MLIISAIAFVNYILLRLYGSGRIRWAGLLGGLVNSTATVTELARRTRTDPRLSVFALPGMSTATTAMLLRNGLILAIFSTTALSYGWLAVALMGAASAAATPRVCTGESAPAPLRMTFPISIRHALTFGALFVAITVAGELASRLLGPAGFLLVAAIGGLVSSASTVAAAGVLAARGALPPALAGYSVAITSMASLVFHVPIAQMAGRNWEVTKRLASLSVLVLGAGFFGVVVESALVGRR